MLWQKSWQLWQETRYQVQCTDMCPLDITGPQANCSSGNDNLPELTLHWSYIYIIAVLPNIFLPFPSFVFIKDFILLCSMSMIRETSHKIFQSRNINHIQMFIFNQIIFVFQYQSLIVKIRLVFQTGWNFMISPNCQI